MRQVLLVNQSTVVSETDFQAAANAVQTQVARDIAPTWNIPAKLWKDTKVTPGYEIVFILDNSDQAGAEGYHTRDAQGATVSYVFAKTSGIAWPEVLSHEVGESLINPYVTDLAEGPYLSGRAIWPHEIGDMLEGTGYEIDGVPVANFALPKWFEEEQTAGPFDFRGVLSKPFTLAPTGYASIETAIGTSTDVWGADAKPGGGKEAQAGAYSRLTAYRKARASISPGFGSVSSNLNYIIRLLNQQSRAIAAIATSINDPNNDPQALVDATNQLRASGDALEASVKANQPK